MTKVTKDMSVVVAESIERGWVAATLLRGAWREDTPPSDASIDAVLFQTLKQTGSLGLIARRLDARSDAVALEARAVWRWQQLHSVVRGRVVARVVQALGSIGIEPVLLKGLAAARHYRVAGVRPTGDIDLLVAPCDLRRAADVVRELGFKRTWSVHPGWIALEGPDGVIDLQVGLWPLSNNEAAHAMRSDESFVVEGVPVRVPQGDLELRFFAIHAVKHGFLRPMWLCDVAAAIETSEHLDWSSIFAGPWPIRSWIAGAIAVAMRLLGLSVPLDVRARCHSSAPWVDPLVLRRWGDGERVVISDGALVEALRGQRSALAALQGIARGWPDPLHVVVHRGWPLDHTVARAAVLFAASERALAIVRYLARAPR
jgi:Uncharacterised nucleotidyltransferase